MPELTYRATLDHPPGVVFDYVADAENNPTWHEHVRETRWLDDGPTRLGRRGRQTGRLFWRDWHFVAEVAEWDPPHLVAFQVIEGTRVRTTIRVEPSGDGTLMWLTVRTPRDPRPPDRRPGQPPDAADDGEAGTRRHRAPPGRAGGARRSG